MFGFGAENEALYSCNLCSEDVDRVERRQLGIAIPHNKVDHTFTPNMDSQVPSIHDFEPIF